MLLPRPEINMASRFVFTGGLYGVKGKAPWQALYC